MKLGLAAQGGYRGSESSIFSWVCVFRFFHRLRAAEPKAKQSLTDTQKRANFPNGVHRLPHASTSLTSDMGPLV